MPAIDLSSPFMTLVEIQSIEIALRSFQGPVHALEWGSGGSICHFPTILAGGSSWLSIEHDKEFFESIQARLSGLGNCGVSLYHIPPTKPIVPPDDGDLSALRDYVRFPATMGRMFDFILVDGRARCDCQAAGWQVLANDGLMVLHDAQRLYYAPGFPQDAFWVRMGNPSVQMEGTASVLFMSRSTARIKSLFRAISENLAGSVVTTSNLPVAMQGNDGYRIDHPSRKLRVFASPEFLPPGHPHVPMLYPFWGMEEYYHQDAGRYDRLAYEAHGFIEQTDLADADVALFPANWTADCASRLEELVARAANHGKQVLVFEGSDSEAPMHLPGCLVFRTSARRSRRSPSEYGLPAWSVDFLDRYFGHVIPPRPLADVPTVGFCGLVPKDPSHPRTRSIARLRGSSRLEVAVNGRDYFWGQFDHIPGERPTAEAWRQQYVKSMADCDYVMCVRGAGNFSYRLYETLCCGRIPVFVDTACILPLEDEIDWKDLCVWVPFDKIEHLEERILGFHAALTPEKFLERQGKCRRIWERYLSPHGFFRTIAQKLLDGDFRLGERPGKILRLADFGSAKDKAAETVAPGVVGHVSHGAAGPALSSTLSEGNTTGTQKRSCVFLHTCYPAYLRSVYECNPEWARLPYDQQLDRLIRNRFGDSDYYSRGLRAAGWDATDLLVNCPPLQSCWATQSGLAPETDPLKILLRQVESARPDVIYLHDLALADENFLKALRPLTRLIVGQIASPVPPWTFLKGFDLLFSSLPNLVQRFRERGVTAYHQRLAFDAAVLAEIGPASHRPFEVTFVGGLSPEHRQRSDFLGRVARAAPLRIWGYGADSLAEDNPLRQCHQGPAWGLDYFRILAQSSISLNLHIDLAGNFANNMRLFEATGCGALLVTDYKDNLADLFEIGTEIVAYRSEEDCLAQLAYLLCNPDRAKEIAAAGQQRTLREHTYVARMSETARVLEHHLKRLAQTEPHPIEIQETGTEAAADPSRTWKSPEIPARQRFVVDEQLSQLYAGKVQPHFQALADCLQECVSPNGRILEIGCSSGYYHEILRYLLRKPHSYVGVDYSAALLQMAKSYYPNMPFLLADGKDLPLASNSFETVISSCILLHCEDHLEHIRETARVSARWIVAHRTPVCRQRATFRFEKVGYGLPMIEFRFNEDEFLGMFRDVGFRMVKRVEFDALPHKDESHVTYLLRKFQA